MPSINDSLDFQRAPSSAFISPFSNASPAVIYSSITIPGTGQTSSCLSCAAQDLTGQQVEQILSQLVVPAPAPTVRSGLVALPTVS